MNGIRYASACFGGPHKLVRELPKQWCYKIRTIRANIGTSGSRGFHRSIECFATAEEESDKLSRKTKRNLFHGPDLADFILANRKSNHLPNTKTDVVPYLKNVESGGLSVYFEVYGCQMNVNDSDVVWAILKKHGYKRSADINTANIILLVTCAIREKAEEKVWNKLEYLKALKARRRPLGHKYPMKIGLLGCMAERLKDKVLERNRAVDIVAGPDSYKDLPRLLMLCDRNETAINVILSADETYADVMPVRFNENSKSAFVTIMRGCDNMCSYCIVPFTRGRERSRPVTSILSEVQHLSDQGVKEITLLGQNVNSYRDLTQSDFYVDAKAPTDMAKGFNTVYKTKMGGLRFGELLDKVSLINPEIRIRFTSPHPKDFPDQVLQLIAERPNVCKQLHLPAQSGNSAVLERMRRGYTRGAYLKLVDHVRNIIPNVSLSSDFIAGFCGETEAEFMDTLSLMEMVEYNKAYLFAYSMREKTTAHRRLSDDVAMDTKQERLRKMIDRAKISAEKLNGHQIGSQQLVLIEGHGRKMNNVLVGRNDGNTRVVIPNEVIPESSETHRSRSISPGDYVVVQIYNANMNSLLGVPLYHSSISSYILESEKHRQNIVEIR
ncbi:CDK5RAP1-like protein [Venturia canescens]|uniref:CDK5RAP1-like protein n=1 Tax=Venturia canescens TaxID=32260 RepID=UPI001C9CE596|nr:CDK5RAP1-like protein [Venturia canescens]